MGATSFIWASSFCSLASRARDSISKHKRRWLQAIPLDIGPYTLTLEQVKTSGNANFDSAVGLVTVSKNGDLVTTLLPERRFYRASDQDTTEVALKSNLKEDLYVVLAGFTKDNSKAIVHAYLNPLVAWIWLGGAFNFIGTIICLIPSQHTRAAERVPSKLEVKEYAKL